MLPPSIGPGGSYTLMILPFCVSAAMRLRGHFLFNINKCSKLQFSGTLILLFTHFHAIKMTCAVFCFTDDPLSGNDGFSCQLAKVHVLLQMESENTSK